MNMKQCNHRDLNFAGHYSNVNLRANNWYAYYCTDRVKVCEDVACCYVHRMMENGENALKILELFVLRQKTLIGA